MEGKYLWRRKRELH